MTDLGVEVVSRKDGLGYLFMVQVLSSRDQIWFGLVCFLPRRVAPSATADPRGLAPSTISRDIVMSTSNDNNEHMSTTVNCSVG